MKIELEELHRRKLKMERQLALSISNIIESFEEDTGLTPNNISVCFAEDRQLGKIMPRYIVSNVSTNIEI